MEELFKIRASQATKILPDAKGGTPKEQYEACVAKIAAKKDEFRACSEKAVKTKEKLKAEITELEFTTLPILEDTKHISLSLSVGAMTYVKQWLKERRFNRKRVVSSKYFEKGNYCEDASIELLVGFLGWPFDTVKNTISKENEFFTGTPDVVLLNQIPDVKNSWSWSTFPCYDESIENKDYDGQLNVYEELFQKPEGLLCYTLMDASQKMIDAEYWKKHRDEGLEFGDEVDADLYEFVRLTMTYSDLPIDKRVKCFPHKHDAAIISKLEGKVLECREYVKYLLTLNKSN